MIRLDLETPLARFPLRIQANLDAPVTAVMGPSGAGKTSLLDAIAGLRPVASGRIAIGELSYQSGWWSHSTSASFTFLNAIEIDPVARWHIRQ